MYGWEKCAHCSHSHMSWPPRKAAIGKKMSQTVQIHIEVLKLSWSNAELYFCGLISNAYLVWIPFMIFRTNVKRMLTVTHTHTLWPRLPLLLLPMPLRLLPPSPPPLPLPSYSMKNASNYRSRCAQRSHIETDIKTTNSKYKYENCRFIWKNNKLPSYAHRIFRALSPSIKSAFLCC